MSDIWILLLFFKFIITIIYFLLTIASSQSVAVPVYPEEENFPNNPTKNASTLSNLPMCA